MGVALSVPFLMMMEHNFEKLGIGKTQSAASFHTFGNVLLNVQGLLVGRASTDAEKFAALIKSEIPKWAKLIKEAGIKQD